MQIKEILSYLESLAPLDYQESYDNAGLLAGDPCWDLRGTLICLDITEAVVDEALDRGCNLIISHHPVIFRPIGKITPEHAQGRILMRALKEGIALYGAHTNLDQISGGVSSRIARQLDLVDARVLEPLKGRLRKLHTFIPEAYLEQVRSALFAAGAGHIGAYGECSFQSLGLGTYKPLEGSRPFAGERGIRHQEAEVRLEVLFETRDEPGIIRALKDSHPYEEISYDILSLENTHPLHGAGIVGELPGPLEPPEFLRLLRQRMLTGCIRHTRLPQGRISRVAVCGGAGFFLLARAREAGADAFVTADLKYHEFFEAENQILITDIGHYESEQFTVDLIWETLIEKFPNFAPLKSRIPTNPVNYFI